MSFNYNKFQNNPANKNAIAAAAAVANALNDDGVTLDTSKLVSYNKTPRTYSLNDHTSKRKWGHRKKKHQEKDLFTTNSVQGSTSTSDKHNTYKDSTSGMRLQKKYIPSPSGLVAVDVLVLDKQTPNASPRQILTRRSNIFDPNNAPNSLSRKTRVTRSYINIPRQSTNTTNNSVTLPNSGRHFTNSTFRSRKTSPSSQNCSLVSCHSRNRNSMSSLVSSNASGDSIVVQLEKVNEHVEPRGKYNMHEHKHTHSHKGVHKRKLSVPATQIQSSNEIDSDEVSKLKSVYEQMSASSSKNSISSSRISHKLTNTSEGFTAHELYPISSGENINDAISTSSNLNGEPDGFDYSRNKEPIMDEVDAINEEEGMHNYAQDINHEVNSQYLLFKAPEGPDVKTVCSIHDIQTSGNSTSIQRIDSESEEMNNNENIASFQNKETANSDLQNLNRVNIDATYAKTVSPNIVVEECANSDSGNTHGLGSEVRNLINLRRECSNDSRQDSRNNSNNSAYSTFSKVPNLQISNRTATLTQKSDPRETHMNNNNTTLARYLKTDRPYLSIERASEPVLHERSLSSASTKISPIRPTQMSSSDISFRKVNSARFNESDASSIYSDIPLSKAQPNVLGSNSNSRKTSSSYIYNSDNRFIKMGSTNNSTDSRNGNRFSLFLSHHGDTENTSPSLNDSIEKLSVRPVNALSDDDDDVYRFDIEQKQKSLKFGKRLKKFFKLKKKAR
ncbi:hypothetical protein KAFR_0D03170 [Kazachstania africana CBS 2517]|uniref:Uncharacterized protein n=1 Tax=Kazachstania africana (strain ATCC 22294 / BCRC 22015 / CBS 2517 / CECT 1963 / NBRC 1671 / NRRL Y-8276) TaxID=1071382 RepID=H2AUB5_KAZAF|nr:hypothetical protein KAFR_0D03170 [Kazachstania africana CBS 2517]CCF57965.1 hypothetical protein KAFR_0D03170 [Kazachstania africana CBS 2517]